MHLPAFACNMRAAREGVSVSQVWSSPLAMHCPLLLQLFISSRGWCFDGMAVACPVMAVEHAVDCFSEWKGRGGKGEVLLEAESIAETLRAPSISCGLRGLHKGSEVKCARMSSAFSCALNSEIPQHQVRMQ